MVLYRSIEKTKKHKIVCVHLWDASTGGVKVAIFVNGRFYKIGFLDRSKLGKSREIAYIRGKTAKAYLKERNLRVTQNKSLIGIEQRLV